MKKMITGVCILLVTVMISPVMAQDGRINRRLDKRWDRSGDYHINRGNDHWRGQRSTRFANPRVHRFDQRFSQNYKNYHRHKYSRYNNRHRRHFYSRYKNRYNRHMYSKFNKRYQRQWYSRYDFKFYRNRKNW